MYKYLYLISILICLVSANVNDLGDQTGLDDYGQGINNFDLSLNNNTAQNQNVIDLLQSMQHNSTLNSNTSQQPKNTTTGLSANSSTANIVTLFNSYQYDSPVYQELRSKDESSSSSSQSTTHLDSSGTNQNYYSKEYTGFDDNQKMYIEQQIEQDSKYMPDIFDQPPVPQIIEQPSSAQDNQINTFDHGTKFNNRPTSSRPIQVSYKTPATVSRLNKFSTKGSANSIKMANNQEWNVIDKNQQQQQQNGYIQANSGQIKSTSNNYYQQPIIEQEQSSFSSLDQQIDLTKVNKVKITGQQSNYNSRPIEVVQVTAPNQAIHPFQQQVISSSFSTSSTKQPAVSAQTFNAPAFIQQHQINHSRKPPCAKTQNVNDNYESTRQRPFYFGWKQQQQKQQGQKVTAPSNFIQQQSFQQSYQQQPNKQQYFGLPNQFDQQAAINQYKGIPVRKCCIVKLVPKQRPPTASSYNSGIAQQLMQSSSMMSYYNPFQNNLTGMFGVGVGGLTSKKNKIKNIIKAPFVFVSDMKHKALGLNKGQSNFIPNNNYPNNYPAYPSNVYPTNVYPSPSYIQQQNTFNKPFSQSPEYNY